jgi:hypothetical protein
MKAGMSTLASPIFAISSKRPSAIFAEVLSASMRTARRGERASEGMTASRVQSNGGFHMRVAPLNDLIFNRITIQSDRSMAAGGLLRPGTVCRSSCYTFLPRLRPIRSSAVRFRKLGPGRYSPGVGNGRSARPRYVFGRKSYHRQVRDSRSDDDCIGRT